MAASVHIKMVKNWQKVIDGLKRLVDEVGAFWPKSTPLAGYAEDGPYHCEDCSFLKGKKEGDVFKDKDGKGRCPHPAMLADPKVKKDKDGVAIVNIEKGCCEFVDQIPHKAESLIQISGVQTMARKHPFSHTVIENHGDGTHSVHFVHQDNGFIGPTFGKGDVRTGAGNHDELVDRLMDHTSEPEEGEGKDVTGKPFPSPVIVGSSKAKV